MKTKIENPYITGTADKYWEYNASELIIDWEVEIKEFENHALIKPKINSAKLLNVNVYEEANLTPHPDAIENYVIDRDRIEISTVVKEDFKQAVDLQLDDATITFNELNLEKLEIEFRI